MCFYQAQVYKGQGNTKVYCAFVCMYRDLEIIANVAELCRPLSIINQN